MKKYRSILLTIDVEDWFQVENFKNYIDFSTWNHFELRVEKNTQLILDTLDSFSFRIRATFFVLGWIAQKRPDLVKLIHERGHEVASHGNAHHLCTTLTEQSLKNDLIDSKKRLEDIIGEQVYGYRAPSFAVNDNILTVIKQAGYLYDSSYNSFSAHGRYGTIDLSKANEIFGIYQLNNNFFEIPISNIKIRNRVIPFGGGGYFRLFPFPFFKLGVDSILKKNKPFIFYTHPWEFDPNQPRVKQAPVGFKFRHYINLKKTETKLNKLIRTFHNCHFTTCKNFITS